MRKTRQMGSGLRTVYGRKSNVHGLGGYVDFPLIKYVIRLQHQDVPEVRRFWTRLLTAALKTIYRTLGWGQEAEQMGRPSGTRVSHDSATCMGCMGGAAGVPSRHERS